MSDHYIYHHGILGQKWGVRRYQKEDGTLTSAGKARYNDDGTKKNAKDMSDDDLRSATNRLNNERNYNSALGKNSRNVDISEVAVKSGISAVGSFLAVSGGSLIKDYIDNYGILGKQHVRKATMLGLLGSSVGAITTAAASYGGMIKKE